MTGTKVTPSNFFPEIDMNKGHTSYFPYGLTITETTPLKFFTETVMDKGHTYFTSFTSTDRPRGHAS